MRAKHPFDEHHEVFVRRHANGVAVIFGYQPHSDRLCKLDETYVFTTFSEFTKFLQGWWPEAKP